MAATPFSSVPWLANPGAWWSRDTAAGQLGVQIAQNQIAARKAQADIQMQAQMLPLQKAALESKLQMNSIEVETGKLAIQHALEMKQSEGAVASVYSTAADKGWDSPETSLITSQTIVKYPWLTDSPVVKQIQDYTFKAKAEKVNLEKIQGNLEARAAETDRKAAKDMWDALNREAGINLRERSVVVQEKLLGVKQQFEADKKAGLLNDNDPDFRGLMGHITNTTKRQDISAAQKDDLIDQHVENYRSKRAELLADKTGKSDTPAAESTPNPDAGIGTPIGPVAPIILPRKVSDKNERDALPPGTSYIGPDGKLYLRK